VSAPGSKLDGAAIARALGRDPAAVIVLDEIGSTNDYIRENAGVLTAGSVVFAEAQTHGRGRRGRQWVSPRGGNLLFSVLLRPEFGMEKWSRLTHAAALAVSRGIEKIVPELAAGIKWPNDIFVGGRKIAGILLESHVAGSGTGARFAVAGIGLNVNGLAADWPEELRGSLTSLRECRADKEPVSREEVAVAVVREFGELVGGVDGDFGPVLKEMARRSTLLGKRVEATLPGGRLLEGEAIRFGEEGELVLRVPGEERERVLASVERIRVAGD
jgi:BirA family biotin operon repressor/biotin-[acetyl-CoA-carboxylase] ligase